MSGNSDSSNGTILVIESLGADGDGVARTPTGTVYVPFALPGETVRVRMSGKDRGALTAIATPSRDRRSPESLRVCVK